MFTHHVFFWLKEELSAEDVQNFETGVKSLLSISHLSLGDVGKPAPTERPVIDSSYSYSLLLQFSDEAAHDAYQVDPIHEKFVQTCSPYWSKVLIYDSETV